MSDVAGLFNVPSPDRPDQLAVWAFAHAAHHRDINRIIYEQTLIALPEFLLDPIDINDTGVWEYNHQQMHNDINAILGVSGFNLTDLDWKNPGLLAGFIQLHANEHLQYANILEIG